MKRNILLLLSLTLLTLGAAARSHGEGGTTPFRQRFSTEIGAVCGSDFHRQIVLNLRGGFNYDVSRMAFLICDFEENWQMQEARDHFDRSHILLGGLGLHLLRANTQRGGMIPYSLDLRAAYGSTVGQTNWKNNALEAELQFYPSYTLCKPVVGVGYRFSHGRNDKARDYQEPLHQFYISLGMRF